MRQPFATTKLTRITYVHQEDSDFPLWAHKGFGYRAPLHADSPKPVVLVGANGSGKSILLSHIVNGLVMAKDVVFPEAPEVDPNKVFKFPDPLYIRTGAQWSFCTNRLPR